MLTLTRTVGQEVVIDNKITISISQVKGNQVKLRFQADKNIMILRGELAEDKDGYELDKT